MRWYTPAVLKKATHFFFYISKNMFIHLPFIFSSCTFHSLLLTGALGIICYTHIKFNSCAFHSLLLKGALT